MSKSHFRGHRDHRHPRPLHLAGEQSGDLNYDGTVNTTDLSLFTTAYNAYQLNPIPLGSPTDTNGNGGGTIPEPTSITPLLALTPLSRRRT